MSELIPAANEALAGFSVSDLLNEVKQRRVLDARLADLPSRTLEREVAIRNANQQAEHKRSNREAAQAALTPLLDLAFHSSELDCSDEDLLPMEQMVKPHPSGKFQQIACPACYLMRLADADDEGRFNEVWQPDFMVQLKVADYRDHSPRAREEHIRLALDAADELLALTFHPNRAECSDSNRIAAREQFTMGDRGRNNVSCVRCFLLDALDDVQSWDLRYQLRPHLFNVRPIYIPDAA